MINRREFLRSTALGMTAVATGSQSALDLLANPLGMPIGLQLYTVRAELPKDVTGTITRLAAIGYKEVEVYEFYGKTAAEFGKILKDNGLTAPSGHYLTKHIKSDWEKHIAVAKELGIKYMVNAILEPPERKSLDDYKKAAELFNKAAEQTRKAGIQFCYHNHNFEFKTYGSSTAYDFLLKETDPKLVKFELDCFWVTRAGKDPVDYLTKHPGRFPLLHIKDLKPGYPTTVADDFRPGPFTEVGQGIINWKRIFEAAPKGGMKHYFVEQDECDRPPLESIKISYDYLKNLKV